MASAPSDALKRRHTLVRAAMTERGIDALVVTSLPNVLYLTNFSGSAAIAVIDHDEIRFLTDSRYVTSVQQSQATAYACPGLVLEVVTGSYDSGLALILERRGRARVAFESQHMTVHRYEWLQMTVAADRAESPITWVPTDGIIELARARKDGYELSLFREAGRLLSTVATEVLGSVRGGLTERAIAADIDWKLKSAGFERPAFETIVASGPNGALPHARPSERILGEGDLVVLDFGGVYASYCVDLTRTVVVGPASPRAREVHRAVLEAQDAAVAVVRAGVSRFAIDAAARSVLESHGMGAAFGHGTGHGLGVEIHEDPRIAQRRPGVDTRNEAIEPGMVFTVEPGAYFPDWGGVRIEDDVVVTADGCDRLTTVTRELVEV